MSDDLKRPYFRRVSFIAKSKSNPKARGRRSRCLRGVRLRGMDLSNQDLQGVDMRSADLRNAKLEGADLSFVRLGVSPLRNLGLVAVALLVSMGVGILSGWAGLHVEGWLRSGILEEKLLAALLFAMWISFIVMSWFRGMEKAAQQLLPAFAVLTAALVVLVRSWEIGSGRGVLNVAFLLLSTCILMVIGAFARAVAGTRWQVAFLVVAVAGAAVAGALGGGLLGMSIAVAAAVMGQRALHRPGLYVRLHRVLREVISRLGTRLDEADLRGADFRSAQIDGARFDGALVSGANFEGIEISKFQMDPRLLLEKATGPMSGASPPSQ